MLVLIFFVCQDRVVEVCISNSNAIAKILFQRNSVVPFAAAQTDGVVVELFIAKQRTSRKEITDLRDILHSSSTAIQWFASDDVLLIDPPECE